LKGCKPEKCFVDNCEAWSANEVTINWNAPFMWVLAWADELAR
ncbi:MAG TPA: glycoside hydrolase family 9 protein, partial [Polyangiaceae bacterium]